MIASQSLADWVQGQRARRCAPPPWTFTGHFSRYICSKRMMFDISLETLLKVPDLLARAECSGSEACYIEVARWSYLRERWERFAFEKCFGGEIKEFPDLGDIETCELIADFINQRMRQGRGHSSFVHNLPTFNTSPDL